MIEIKNIILRYKDEEKFKDIKNYIEECHGEDVNDEHVAYILIRLGIENFKKI